MTAAHLTTLIVDYGGVLTTPITDTMASWAQEEGLVTDGVGDVIRAWVKASHHSQATDATSDPIHGLETGRLSAADFEDLLVGALTTVDGRPVQARGLLDRMFAGFRPEHVMNEAVVLARGSGLRTALLSNSWGKSYDRSRWELMFDEVVISGEVGLRKPDPAIYELTCQRLGVPPNECVFVDDLGPNVRAATALGMVGLHHLNPHDTVAELEVLFARVLRSSEPAQDASGKESDG